jgi:hypothetical protein
MQLKSMKVTKEEAEKFTQPVKAESPDAPRYPYGLRLDLNEDVLSKLGLPALPAVNQKMILVARVEVCALSQYDSQDGGKHQSICLQITDMSLDADKEKRDASEVLYPEKKA